MGIRVKTWRVDQDMSTKGIAWAGFQLKVCINPAAFAGTNLFQFAAHFIERETGIRIEGNTGQDFHIPVRPVADNGEFVIHGLGAGRLQRVL